MYIIYILYLYKYTHVLYLLLHLCYTFALFLLYIVADIFTRRQARMPASWARQKCHSRVSAAQSRRRCQNGLQKYSKNIAKIYTNNSY